MKSKILLALLVCFAFSAHVAAQCYAHITYYQNPNSPVVTFYVDSIMTGAAFGNPTFTWSFGDGTAGAGQQTSHIYSLGGGSQRGFIVCLTMIDSSAPCTYTTCDTVLVSPGSGHTCATTVTYTVADSFYTFLSSNSGTAPFTYSWTDNGTVVSTSPVPTLIINNGGGAQGHNICVTVTDSAGCISSDCTFIVDSSRYSCSAYASYSYVDSFYTFSVSHLGGTPVLYQWSFDNNVTVIGTGPTLALTLNAAALLNAGRLCVTITDTNGCISSDCITIGNSPVGGFGCQAYFRILPDSANVLSGYYTGYNLSMGNYGSNILWDFGDGSTSNNPYPAHTYATPGQYIVCLTVGVAGTSCYDTYCDSSFYAYKTNPGLMSHLAFGHPAGIAEAGTDAAIQVYPNPATNVLKINTGHKIETARIFNIAGQLIYTGKAIGNEVNVSTLGSGIYIIEVSYESMTARTKFVKE